MQWIDEPSCELLGVVLRLANARLMIVTTQHPDDPEIWHPKADFKELVLGRLADEDVRRIVRAVAGGRVPAELESRLSVRADGRPFFAEEITRSLVEAGYLVTDGTRCRLTRPAEEIPVPATVQDVIAARLDQLAPPVKRVLQVAAILGRQFRRSDLAPLLERGIDVATAMPDLEARGLLHRGDVASPDEHRFAESMTRDVAYESLLLRERRRLHERAALLLEAAPSESNAERSVFSRIILR
jgi:predicted ATPase